MDHRYAIYLHFIFNAYPGYKVVQSRYSALNEAYLAVYKNPHKSEKSQIIDVFKIGHFIPLMVPNIQYCNLFFIIITSLVTTEQNAKFQIFTEFPTTADFPSLGWVLT